ncbi:MAG: hypothetical protein AAF658_05175 [Myxococcota bacterium]
MAINVERGAQSVRPREEADESATRLVVEGRALAHHHVEELAEFLRGLHEDISVHVERDGFATNGRKGPMDKLRVRVTAGSEASFTMEFAIRSTARARSNAEMRLARAPMLSRGNAFGVAQTLKGFSDAYGRGKGGEFLVNAPRYSGLTIEGMSGDAVARAYERQLAARNAWSS